MPLPAPHSGRPEAERSPRVRRCRSLGRCRIYLRASPGDFRASPSMAGLPHCAGALYPVSVRQLRAWPPASSPPRLAATQSPSARSSHHQGHRGLSPPVTTPRLLAHQKKPASFDAGKYHHDHLKVIQAMVRRPGGVVNRAAGCGRLSRAEQKKAMRWTKAWLN